MGGIITRTVDHILEEDLPVLSRDLFTSEYHEGTVKKLSHDIIHNTSLPKVYSRFADLLISPTQPIILKEGKIFTKQELYSISLSLEKNSEIYVKLANTLPSYDSTFHMKKSNEILSKIELYLEAIELDLMNCNAYLSLASCLPNNEMIVTFKDGTQYTKFELFLKVIELDPSYWEAYYAIASSIPPRHTAITLRNGKKILKKKYYLKAIDLNPCHGLSYYELALTLTHSKTPNQTIELLNKMKLTPRELFIESLTHDPTLTLAYYHLGLSLSHLNETLTLTNRRIYTQKELYFYCLLGLPLSSETYYRLACGLSLKESLSLMGSQPLDYHSSQITNIIEQGDDLETLPGDGMKEIEREVNQITRGKSMKRKNEKEMKKKRFQTGTSFQFQHSSQRFDDISSPSPSHKRSSPSPSPSHKRLSPIHSKSEKFNRSQSYRPVSHSHSAPVTHSHSAPVPVPETHSEQRNTAQPCHLFPSSHPLFSYSSVNRRQLCLIAIECDPKFVRSYDKLASTLEPNEKIRLKSGEMVDKQGLYMLCLRYDPSFARAYYNLAVKMTAKDRIIIPVLPSVVFPSSLSPRQEINPEINQSEEEREEEKVGVEMNAIQLYLQAIRYDPRLVQAYNNLAIILPTREMSVRLSDGTYLSRKELLLRAIEIDPFFLPSYYNLSNTLSDPTEKIGLNDGRIMSCKDLQMIGKNNLNESQLVHHSSTGEISIWDEQE